MRTSSYVIFNSQQLVLHAYKWLVKVVVMMKNDI
jgi:hypothetical protein